MTQNLRTPTYDQFLECRAVIIKAIATAWHDKRFLEDLEARPVETLKERFGYDYPFKIALKVYPHSATWTPEINGGWTTVHKNKFTLVLPPAPPKKEQHAIALASYNANHITSFGREFDTAVDNATPSLESMLEFQQVYLRAIALSWENKTFKEDLKKHPADAFARYFDYRSPWLVEIEIVEHDDESAWDEDNSSWNLPLNTMTFGIPDHPKPGSEETVALAAYSGAGQDYPFTCM